MFVHIFKSGVWLKVQHKPCISLTMSITYNSAKSITYFTFYLSWNVHVQIWKLGEKPFCFDKRIPLMFDCYHAVIAFSRIGLCVQQDMFINHSHKECVNFILASFRMSHLRAILRSWNKLLLAMSHLFNVYAEWRSHKVIGGDRVLEKVGARLNYQNSF